MRILFLDDDPKRAHRFLEGHPQAVWVQTVEECLAQMAAAWEEIHLDHDLGGKQYVDFNEPDCGMEVIRWLCKEPRDHLKQTHFLVHTHNSVAGLFMVLQMRMSGYTAEFRPFGLDLAAALAHNEPECTTDSSPRAAGRSAGSAFSNGCALDDRRQSGLNPSRNTMVSARPRRSGFRA